MKWRTEKAMYMVKEISAKKVEEYHMYATGDEISAWCKSKNEFNGYVPGLGGDRTYSCVAWLMQA